MTLPRLEALQKHWESYPPVHVTAAVFAGVEAKPGATSTAPTAAPAPIGTLSNADIVRDMHHDPRKVKWINKAG